MERFSFVRNVLAGLALIATMACASMPNGEPVRVVVQNDNWMDVNVEVGEDTLWERLGTVGTAEAETFTIPEHVSVEDLHVRLDPIGSDDAFVSREVFVSGGETIIVEVPAALSQVAVSVY